jgi:hypothetical protein
MYDEKSESWKVKVLHRCAVNIVASKDIQDGKYPS